MNLTGDLRLSGSIIRKSRFIFTKERRTIRLKSGCLHNSNELIYQVNIQMQGQIYFTKERRTIRLKSGCLDNSNELIFQVNIQMQGQVKDSL